MSVFGDSDLKKQQGGTGIPERGTSEDMPGKSLCSQSVRSLHSILRRLSFFDVIL